MLLFQFSELAYKSLPVALIVSFEAITQNKYSVSRSLLFEQCGMERLEGKVALALQVAELNLQQLRTRKHILAYVRELPGILLVSL